VIGLERAWDVIVRVSKAIPPPSGRKPGLNLAPRQVKGLKQQLVAYHRHFADVFQRKEQRCWALKYLEGQMLDLQRKSIEPMALAVEGGNVQAMQQFVSQGAWSDAELIRRHQTRVAQTLGRRNGVLILDGCDYPKQGDDSVGVARQYCGPLGQVANCQASVVLAYASEVGQTLLDRRLYLPKKWFKDAHRERWRKCGIPEDTTFHTTPELGAAMIDALLETGAVPFQWVTMDEGYGRAPHLLDRIHAHNKYFFAEVPRHTRVWRIRPKVVPPGPPPATGRHPTVTYLAPEAPAAQRVDQLAPALPQRRWKPFIVHEGTKGPIAVEVAAVRVVMVADALPGRSEWLVIRRPLGQHPLKTWKFFRCNAPKRTSLKTLARLTAWRWPVETVIEECKGELGLDDYEVRNWTGWHHHTALTMLSHQFLVELRVEMEAESPALTVSQVRKLLQAVLPKRELDEADVIVEIARVQQRNYAAYCSHRKHRRQALRKSKPN
jgi:SRSO17 transposase